MNRFIIFLLAITLSVGASGVKAHAAMKDRTAIVRVIKLKMTGRCKSAPKGGSLRLTGSGFTPNQSYKWKVWYPSGRLYTYNPFGITDGAVDARGMIDIVIACSEGAGGKPDPPGIYRIQLTDVKSGLKGEIHYTIDPATGTQP